MMLEKEREYYEMMHATLNGNVPSRTLDEYNIDNKEKISTYKKQYCENNQEKLLEQNHQYKHTNKQALAEQQSQRWICPECKSNVRWGDMARHKRSQKHQQALEQLVLE